MEHFDAFYTPPDIAEEMVSAIRRSSLACVADFAVGDGRLLRAVEARLRTKHLIGMDIVEVAPAYDQSQITALAAAHIACDLICLFAKRKADGLVKI